MINIGDTISGDDLMVPVGTSFVYNSVTYTREVDGWHASSGGHYQHPRTFRNGGEVTEMVPFTETLDQYKQRFAVTTIAMGHMAGGGGYLSGAYDIVEQLGLENPENEAVREGSWVNSYVNYAQVPQGSVLLSGARNRGTGHTLATLNGRTMRVLSGPRLHHETKLWQVVAVPPDVTTQAWAAPAEDEEDRIRAFRVQAWDIAYQVKMDRGWCDDFETNISILSLSSDVANRLRTVGAPAGTPWVPGTTVTLDGLTSAPVGTVIHEGTGWRATKRTDGDWDYTSSGGYTGQVESRDITLHPGLTYRSIGVTGERFAYGTQVSSRQQRSCALGAVFTYMEGTTRYLWARTNEGGTNGTRGIALGSEGVHWSNSNTSVIWDGISPIHEVPVRDHREMTLMPVGTMIGQEWDGARFNPLWEKFGPDDWRSSLDNIRLPDNGLSTGPLRYAYIPVPGVPRPGWAPASINVDDTDDDPF